MDGKTDSWIDRWTDIWSFIKMDKYLQKDGWADRLMD